MSEILDGLVSGYELYDTFNEDVLLEDREIKAGAPLFLYGFMKQSGLMEVFDQLDCSETEKESILALLCFYLCEVESDKQALFWFVDSILFYLFPRADLKASSIDTLLIKAGQKAFQQDFFAKWMDYLKSRGFANKNMLCGSWIDVALDDLRESYYILNPQADFPSFQLLFGFDQTNRIPLFFQMPEDLFERELGFDGQRSTEIWCNQEELEQALEMAKRYDPAISLCSLQCAYEDLDLLNLFYEKAFELRQGFLAGVNLHAPVCENIVEHELEKLESFDYVIDLKGRPYCTLTSSIYLDQENKHEAWLTFYIDLDKRRQVFDKYGKRIKRGTISQRAFVKKTKTAGCFATLCQTKHTPEALLEEDERFRKQTRRFRLFMDHHLSIRRQARKTFDGYLFFVFATYGIERLLDLFLKRHKADGYGALMQLDALEGLVHDGLIECEHIDPERERLLFLLYDLKFPVTLKVKDGRVDLSNCLKEIDLCKENKKALQSQEETKS